MLYTNFLTLISRLSRLESLLYTNKVCFTRLSHSIVFGFSQDLTKLTELGGITDMSRVNCDEIWEELSSKGFVNLSPSSEHDRVSVRKLANLI